MFSSCVPTQRGKGLSDRKKGIGSPQSPEPSHKFLQNPGALPRVQESRSTALLSIQLLPETQDPQFHPLSFRPLLFTTQVSSHPLHFLCLDSESGPVSMTVFPVPGHCGLELETTTSCFSKGSSYAWLLALLSTPSTAKARAPSCPGELMSTTS
jgi:hypothetical protein